MGARPSSFKKAPEETNAVVEAPGRIWSDQQQSVFDWFRVGSGNLIVRARAGTGKTTTILEGVTHAPEQNILLAAFSKDIQVEMEKRIQNSNVEVKTLHGLGFNALTRYWRKVKVDAFKRQDNLTNAVVERDTPKPIRTLVSKLHTAARDQNACTPGDLTRLAEFHNLVPDDAWTKYNLAYVVERAQRACDLAATEGAPKDGVIDFADMIFQPLVRNWLAKDYDLVVVDECFPAGTRVWTEEGLRPIETLRIGDRIANATGFGLVTRVMENTTTELIRIELDGHKPLVCTPNHPFFTQVGWVRASNLAPSHVMIKPQTVLEIYHDLRTLPEGIYPEESQEVAKESAQILQSVLRREVEYESSRDASGNSQSRGLGKSGEENIPVVPDVQSRESLEGRQRSSDARGQSNGACRGTGVRKQDSARDEASAPSARGERTWAYRSGATVTFAPDRCGEPTCGAYEDSTGIGVPDLLQDRHRDTVVDAGDRGGRQQPPTAIPATTGREENQVSGAYRVVRTTLLKPGDSGFPGDCCRVYNLSVSGHPSYVVEDVLVHNCQDLTVAQLEMAQRVCYGRICLVGDDKQAIFSFRGADSGSIDRLKKELQAVELPLTVTYRCCQAVVRKAQELVPDLQAHASNPEGQITTLNYDDALDAVRPGDFVVSRLNAPLVAMTLELLRERVRARMLGRDVGTGIRNVLKGLKCYDTMPTGDVLNRIEEWRKKKVTPLAAEGKLDLVDRINDQAGMLNAFACDTATAKEMFDEIESLFVDKEGDAEVILSSIHKIKGKEANRVFVLKESLYRRKEVTPDEDNCFYVAITRAKTHLTWVTGVPGLQRRP